MAWLAIPTQSHPYFGFALSTGPQVSVRPLQQYRQHNKINKSIFPDIFWLNHVYTRMYTRTHTENLKFCCYNVLTKASSLGPSAVHTQPGRTARQATTHSAPNRNHIHTMATPRLWVPGERQASNCSYQHTTAKSVKFFTLCITKGEIHD